MLRTGSSLAGLAHHPSCSGDAPNICAFHQALAAAVKVEDVFEHLMALQRIANANNGNRAVSTTGFNETVEYVNKTLHEKTNFNITCVEIVESCASRINVVISAPTVCSISKCPSSRSPTGRKSQ